MAITEQAITRRINSHVTSNISKDGFLRHKEKNKKAKKKKSSKKKSSSKKSADEDPSEMRQKPALAVKYTLYLDEDRRKFALNFVSNHIKKNMDKLINLKK